VRAPKKSLWTLRRWDWYRNERHKKWEKRGWEKTKRRDNYSYWDDVNVSDMYDQRMKKERVWN